jgi:site-specific recombinase XerD
MKNQLQLLEVEQDMTLGEATNAFLEEALLGTSQETYRWYTCRLGLFIKAHGASKKLSEITKKDLISWWRGLEARTLEDPPTLTVDSFHGYVRGPKRLFSWLYERRVINQDLAGLMKLPTLPERQRKGVHDEIVVKLIEATEGNLRDRAIMLFLESTGARRAGVASLKMEDIEPYEPEPYCRRAAVLEKGQKKRAVFMSHLALEALKEYLESRNSTSKYVFLDTRPGRENNKLKPGAINQIIERYKKQLGISGTVSPHQWRHRYCRNLLQNKMPLSTVQQLAGHKSIQVTAMIYANLLVDELHDAYDETYSPLKITDNI